LALLGNEMATLPRGVRHRSRRVLPSPRRGHGSLYRQWQHRTFLGSSGTPQPRPVGEI